MISGVGYQGRTPDAFYAALVAAKVSHLFDVRLIAYSAVAAFRSPSLAVGCRERGIVYRHYPQLGTPADIRERYKRDGNIDELLAAFRQRAEIFTTFDALIAWYQRKPRHVALLCYERDGYKCHRSVLLSYAAERGVEVGHL